MCAACAWTATHTMRPAPNAHARRAPARTLPVDRARLAQMAAHVDKAAFTRADMVELLGAQLPVDARGDPRALIEAMADEVGVRISAPAETHHCEGHVKYTVDAVMHEEEAILAMVDDADTRTRLDLRPQDIGDLSTDQARAIANIATSAHLVEPLQAPAGAGKTHSLKALRAAAHRAQAGSATRWCALNRLTEVAGPEQFRHP